VRVLVTGGAGYIGPHTATRAASLLGWAARFGLEDILASAWRWPGLHRAGHRSEHGATRDPTARSRARRSEQHLAPAR
jgi:UDP-glucose 4-epimerase